MPELRPGLAALRAREHRMRRAGDRQGAFAAAYIEVMEALQGDLWAGRYEDQAWVARCARRFLALYFAALDDTERGWHWRVPQAWQQALAAPRRRRGSCLGSLVLGMNAHINHDLPLAIAETLPGGDVSAQARDYRRILATLRGCIAPIQARLGRDYAAGLGRLDRAAVGLDDAVTYLTIRLFRRQGWAWALRLRAQPRQRARLREALDHRAARCGLLICTIAAPSLSRPWQALEAPLQLGRFVATSPARLRYPPRECSPRC